MRKHLGLFTTGAAALALALGIGPALQSAQAEYFDYDGTVSISNVSSGWTISTNDSPNVVLTTATGDTVSLAVTPADLSDGYYLNGLGQGTTIRFGSISAVVTPNTPLQDLSFDFTYKLTLYNHESEEIGPSNPVQGTGAFEISGKLSGSVGAGRSVNLNNLQGYAVNPYSQIINGVPYLITRGDNFFTPPGVGANNFGTFSAHVQAVPEPVSVISTALGFLGLGGFLANNRRRNRKAQAA